MADITLSVLLLSALYGIVGAGLYVFVNKLLEQKLFLQVAEHLVAGAFVGIVSILLLGYAVPDTIYAAAPIITAGYFALDVIDSVAQKYAGAGAPAAAAPKA